MKLLGIGMGVIAVLAVAAGLIMNVGGIKDKLMGLIGQGTGVLHAKL